MMSVRGLLYKCMTLLTIANSVPYINLNNWDEEHRLSVMRTILMAKRKYSDEFRQSLLKSNGKMNIEGTIDHFLGIWSSIQNCIPN